MSALTRPGLRWSVPVGVAALVVGGTVLGPVLSASAEVELPARSPQQLLTDLQTAEVDAFSGTLTQRAELGLPELPEGVGGEYSTDALSLLTGEHTLRVWADGVSARVALHGRMGESDVVTDGEGVWAWSSDDRTATHLVLPDGATGTAHARRAEALAQAMPPVTPETVTAYVLERLEPSTVVSAGPTTSVAGRPAYELVLEPTTQDSLVGSVRIAVDAEEHVATRVRVLAAGAQEPALEVGFTSLSFAAPDPAVFRFTPPEDATVEEVTPRDLGDGGGLDGGMGGLRGVLRPDAALPGTTGASGPAAATVEPDAATADEPTTGARRGAVIGTGWDAVVVGRVPATGGGPDGDLGAFLAALPTVTGEWGSGQLLTSTLFSALLTDDGRLLVGAVGPDALLAAAGDPAAALG